MITEYQKIIDLLDDTMNELSEIRKRYWNDESK